MPLSCSPPILPSPRPQRGATLVSSLLALTVIAVCAGLLLQTALMGGMLRNRLAMRAQALAACQSQMETLRARGYGALPPGATSFPTGSPRLKGQTQVAAGPANGSRLVTVTVSWQPGERLPEGAVSLSTIMSAGGAVP